MRKRSTQPRAVAVCIDTRDGAGRNRLHGVAEFIRRKGWRMMLVRQAGQVAAAEVVRLAPDGIIAYIADRWLLKAARRLSVPLVDTALSEHAAPMSLSLDNDMVGCLAAQHLSQVGLKQFGYCGVSARLASEERRSAFARWLGNRPLASFAEPISECELSLEP